jgi:hypothetical protein
MITMKNKPPHKIRMSGVREDFLDSQRMRALGPRYIHRSLKKISLSRIHFFSRDCGVPGGTE